MKYDILMLPAVELNQVGSARGRKEYLDAHEELRAEAVKAFSEEDAWGTYACPALSVTFFVGAQRKDGRFRPQASHSVWPVLDPIYRAMIDAGLIQSTDQIALISVGVLSGSKPEGIRIAIEEIG